MGFNNHSNYFSRLGQELQEVRSSDDEVHATINLKEIKIEPSVKGKLNIF